MSDTATLAEQVQRDRWAMVSTMSTLANAAEVYKAAAAGGVPRTMAVAWLKRGSACERAAQTIAGLLVDSGVTADEAMAIADELDREEAVLLALSGDEGTTT